MICDLCKKQTQTVTTYNSVVNVCPKCNSRKKKNVLQGVAKVLFEKRSKI